MFCIANRVKFDWSILNYHGLQKNNEVGIMVY